MPYGSRGTSLLKGSMVLLLSAFCLFLTVSNAQTDKKQLLPYDDADGYTVLSSIIDARTNKLKSEPVSIFQKRLSGVLDFSAQAAFLLNFKAPQKTSTRRQRRGFC